MQEAGGVRRIWDFIGKTINTICRPDKSQRFYYGSYKKANAIKYQEIMILYGLISHFSELFDGREGDYSMFNRAGI